MTYWTRLRNAFERRQHEERRKNREMPCCRGDLGRIIATIYKEYEKTLRSTNSLDFDDLLVYGVKLFGKHRKAAAWCRHVLVDE